MTSETLSVATLAAFVRAGTVPIERLTPELQDKISAHERGEIADEKEENYDEESREGDY